MTWVRMSIDERECPTIMVSTGLTMGPVKLSVEILIN